MTIFTHTFTDTMPALSEPFFFLNLSLDTELTRYFESYNIPTVLLRNVKAIDYARASNLVIIPSSFRVMNVFNGYVVEQTFELRLAATSRALFKQYLEQIEDAIDDTSKDDNVFIIYTNSERFDRSIRGLFREIFEVTVILKLPIATV